MNVTIERDTTPRISRYLVFVSAFVIGVDLAVDSPIGGSIWAIAVRLAAAGGLVALARDWLDAGNGEAALGRSIGAGLLAAIVVAGGGVEESSPLRERIGGERLRGVLRARVVSGPEPLEGGWGITLNVRNIDGDQVRGASRVRLFVPPECVADRGPPYPGDVIEVFARLEQYPRKRFPGRRGERRRMRRLDVVARGIAQDELELVGYEIGVIDRIGRRLAQSRLAYLRTVFEYLPTKRARYVAAMTAGARGLLTGSQTEPFRRTGTSHLLAISGLHLGILASLLWWVFGRIVERFPLLLRRWGRRRVCAIPVLAVLALYVWAIGVPVSAGRSLLMVAGVVGAIVSARPVDSLHGLATAALVLLAWEPARVAGLGFQLSFSATAAILWFLERRPPVLEPDGPLSEGSPWWRRWVRRGAVGAGVSLSATLATWPVLLAWHGWVPPDAIWVNLLVTPFVGATAVPLLFVGAAATSLVPSIGAPILELGAGLVAATARSLDWVAAVPPGAVVVGQVAVVVAWMLQAGVFIWIGSRLRPRPLAVGGMVVGVALAIHSWTLSDRHGLRVHFIPVGQGDATLVEFPNDRTLLVDAGGSAFGSDPGRRIVVPYLRRLGIGELDWVIATHADIDHVGGLHAVFSRAEPGRFIYDSRASREMAAVASSARRAGVSRRRVRGARSWSVGPASVTVLQASRELRSGENDRSLVTRISYGGRTVLLPGDVEASAERSLVRRGLVETDLLKVPHHGSKTSSTPGFLEASDPSVAVVSAGRFNAFGHPHSVVLRRYRDRGVRIFRTSRDGLVRARFTADGSMEIRAIRRVSSRR